MANVLKKELREQVIKCLLEGSSIRSTERLTGVHRDTILRLMVRVGNGSKKLMDEKLRNLHLSQIQMDEIGAMLARNNGTFQSRKIIVKSVRYGRSLPLMLIPN